MALSISSAEATPVSRMPTASLTMGTRILFTRNPGASFTSTGSLSTSLQSWKTKSKVSWVVLAPRMISTSFMVGTGLKKCIPMTGCFRPRPISVMEREEVLEAKTVLSLQRASNSFRSVFFVSISSFTHSMTRSASAQASFSSTRMRESSASTLSWVIRPLSTCRCSVAANLSLCFCAEAVELAYKRAVCPFAAKVCAMPLPMVPAPKIAIFMFHL